MNDDCFSGATTQMGKLFLHVQQKPNATFDFFDGFCFEFQPLDYMRSNTIFFFYWDRDEVHTTISQLFIQKIPSEERFNSADKYCLHNSVSAKHGSPLYQ